MTQLEAVDSAEYCCGNMFQSEAFARMRKEINEKYDERVRLYLEGIHQWDTQISVIMVLRGEKA